MSLGTALASVGKNEEALRQNEERLRAMIASALDAIVSTDSEGLIIEWNAQAEKMFGWPRHSALGRKLADTTIPSPRRAAYLADMRDYLKAATQSVLKKRIETTALHADGHIFPVEIALTSAFVESQVTLTAFIRDITERKEAERRTSAQLAIARVLAASPKLDDAIPRLLKTIAEQLGFHFGAFWTREPQTNSMQCQNVWCDQPAKFKAFPLNDTFIRQKPLIKFGDRYFHFSSSLASPPEVSRVRQ